MRARLLSSFLLVSLLFSHSCWADVVFTDQEYQELTEVLNQLEILNNEQQKTIDSLETQNVELQTQSENKQKILEEQNQILKRQENSLRRERKFSWLTTLLSSLITAILGFVGGIFVC